MLLYAGRFSYAKARSDGPECEEDLAAAAKAKSKGGRQLIGGLLIFINFGVPSLSLSTYIFSGSVDDAQGYGYKSAQKAYAGWAYKNRDKSRITVQSGGTVNGMFLREKLFDYVDIVVAPVLIGGKETSTLIDGHTITNVSELSSLGVLQLESCETLDNSYIRLRYKVIS